MLIKLNDGTIVGEELKNGLRNLCFNCDNCGTEFVANVSEGVAIYPPVIEHLGSCNCPFCGKIVYC